MTKDRHEAPENLPNEKKQMNFSPTMKYAIPPNLEVPNLEHQIREELIKRNDNFDILAQIQKAFNEGEIISIMINKSLYDFKIASRSVDIIRETENITLQPLNSNTIVELTLYEKENED